MRYEKKKADDANYGDGGYFYASDDFHGVDGSSSRNVC